MKYLLSLWAFIATILATNCMYFAGNGCAEGDFEEIFIGFEFMGGYQIIEGHPIPPHAEGVAGIPREFVTGFRYVFHLSSIYTNAELALAVFPGRLEERGFTVTSRPNSEDDFAIPDMGGPIWEIRFEKGNCRGRIYNFFDGDLDINYPELPSSQKQDYILEVLDTQG